MTTTMIHSYEDETPGAWETFIAAMYSGKPFECDEAMWYHWLEVLPPVWMNRTIEVAGKSRRCTFGFAEGREYITAFWRESNADRTGWRYFGCRTTEMARGW